MPRAGRALSPDACCAIVPRLARRLTVSSHRARTERRAVIADTHVLRRCRARGAELGRTAALFLPGLQKWSGSVGERVESESRTSVGVASLREEGIARPHDTSTRVHARGAKENKHAPVSNPLCKRTRRRRPMVHKRSSRQPRIPQRTLPSASLRLLQSGLLGTCVAYLSSTQPGTSGLAGTARCNSLCCALPILSGLRCLGWQWVRRICQPGTCSAWTK